MTMKAMIYPPIEHLKAVEIILTALKDLRRTWMHTGKSDQPFAICCYVDTAINDRDLGNKQRIQQLWRGMSNDAYQTWPYWTGSHGFPVPPSIHYTEKYEDYYGLERQAPYVTIYKQNMYWTGEYGQMRGALLEHLIKHFSEERNYAQQQAATCKQAFTPTE